MTCASLDLRRSFVVFDSSCASARADPSTIFVAFNSVVQFSKSSTRASAIRRDRRSSRREVLRADTSTPSWIFASTASSLAIVAASASEMAPVTRSCRSLFASAKDAGGGGKE